MQFFLVNLLEKSHVLKNSVVLVKQVVLKSLFRILVQYLMLGWQCKPNLLLGLIKQSWIRLRFLAYLPLNLLDLNWWLRLNSRSKL
jgi:hypothetical protein